MTKQNVLNLDFDKIGNVVQNATNILKGLMGREDGFKSCVFQISLKEFEIDNGELHFAGRKVAQSTHDDVCRCLLEKIGWMQYLLSCGADKNDYAGDERLKD